MARIPRPAKRGKTAPPPPVRPLTAPLTLVITGAPVTKKNHGQIITNRRTGKPMLLPAPQYRAWAKEAIPQIQPVAYERGAIEQPVCLSAVIYRARRVGDLVNYIQAVADLLEDAGVLTDDKWIVALDGSRLDCDKHNPRVELTLTPEAHDAAA